MTSATGIRPPSYRSTADTDPYGFYARAREQGEVVWDAGLNAWLVLSYDACKEVMRNDKVLFRHPYSSLDDPTITIIEGERSRNLLHGDEHARHHRWFIHHFSPNVVDVWRETIIRPVIRKVVDEFAGDGRVELTRQYAYRVPVRVIAAVMGMPWQDDAWVDRCKRLLDLKLRYLDAHGVDPDGSIEREAIAAAHEMNEIVTPFVEAARAREPVAEDIMAVLWAEGARIMPDWSIVDMRMWVSGTFFAGTDTTTHAISNSLYLLMTSPGLREQVAAAGEDGIRRLAEEVLRLRGTVHWRFRMANVDTEVAGVEIARDDMLYVLLQAGNRDGRKYERPDEIDLDRPAPRDHLAFSFGPRTCAGQALARAEIEETIRMALGRLPGLRLDPAAPPPGFLGFVMRSYAPLEALFETA